MMPPSIRMMFTKLSFYRCCSPDCLFLPCAGITISTRERAGFRDHVIGMVATRISAGVKVGVGGHDEDAKGDEQFEISDDRSVEEIRNMIRSRGLQPVFTDYVYV